MKKSIFVAVLSIVSFSAAAWAHEGHQHGEAPKAAEAPKVDAEHGPGGKAVTFKGELVDMACYMAHEGKGKKHAKCAEMCVLGGSPLGILGPEGALYLLVEDHSSTKAKKPYAQAKKLVAETVTLSGLAYERGGVRAIVVASVSKE